MQRKLSDSEVNIIKLYIKKAIHQEDIQTLNVYTQKEPVKFRVKTDE